MQSMTSRTSSKSFKVLELEGTERRAHRRHEFGGREVTVDRWEGNTRQAGKLGELMDISGGGLRVRVPSGTTIRPDQHIRLRLELPEYAGIKPFIDRNEEGAPSGKREWVGWLSVCRVQAVNDKQMDVAGRLIDMDEMDRGMLGLYLSTQPLAA